MFLLHAENNTEIIFTVFFKPARVAIFHGWCIKIKITEVTLHLLKSSAYHTTIGQLDKAMINEEIAQGRT